MIKKYKYGKHPKSYSRLREKIFSGFSHGAYFTRDFEYPWCVLNSNLIKKANNKRVLDIGSGLNPLPFYLKSRGFDVYCLDSQNYGEFYNKVGIVFNEGDLKKMPYDNYFFDFIYCISVFEHIDKKSFISCITEVVRLLKENGQFIVTMDVQNSCRTSDFVEIYENILMNQKMLKLLKKDMLLLNNVEEITLYVFEKNQGLRLWTGN